MTTATRTAPRATAPAPSALSTHVLSAAEITAILRGAGAIDDAGSSFDRMKVDGSNFTAGSEVWVSNPRTGEAAFTARIMEPPLQYQAFWFNQAAAEFANRPNITDKMCKSYYDEPTQARKFSVDGASCDACPFNPFKDAPLAGMGKCGWKGDLQIQVIPDDGQLKGDEPTYTLTLSTTGMIEFRGTRKEPEKGSVTDANFLHRLAIFAIEHAAEWKLEPEAAIRLALTSLGLGGVAAEFRIHRANNPDKGNTWSVVSLTPVYVETDLTAAEGTPQIAAGEDVEVPF